MSRIDQQMPLTTAVFFRSLAPAEALYGVRALAAVHSAALSLLLSPSKNQAQDRLEPSLPAQTVTT